MKVIKKYCSDDFKGFDYDSLPDSNGYKFEVYFKPSDDLVAQSILYFYSLFGSFSKNILLKPFGQESEWGNFCLDTWDMENDRYDYSPENKKEPTASYLAMLKDSEVEPGYTGLCECVDWDRFLYVTLHCVMQHTAPYSMMFYDPNNEFVFYFHYSASFGICYKDLNESVKNIIETVKKEHLEVENTNDERVLAMVE